MKEALEKYGIKDKGNMQNIYMLEDPSLQDIKLMKRKLDKRLRLGKLGPVKTRYTIIWLFAGHGLLADGGQAIVLNEFDPKKKFYKLFAAEKNIRTIADAYPNTYHVCIFACCRQLLEDDLMGKAISK